jgi:hypothetical protein
MQKMVGSERGAFERSRNLSGLRMARRFSDHHLSQGRPCPRPASAPAPPDSYWFIAARAVTLPRAGRVQSPRRISRLFGGAPPGRGGGNWLPLQDPSPAESECVPAQISSTAGDASPRDTVSDDNLAPLG